jgi:pimeloyl-ACP methyl ester carboxylesterase
VGQSGQPFNWLTLSQDRKQFEWQTFPYGIFKEYTWTPTQSGSYFVQFWHRENTGDANVDISWEAQSPTLENKTITVENKSFPVDLLLYDRGGKKGKAERSNIDPNKNTVVVIHGRGDGTEDTDIIDLAKTAADSQYYPNSQVLYLDWKEAASSKDWIPSDAAKRIRPVAQWATNRLKELGIDPKRTIILGHSLGSYVASEIGRISGGVNNLVALDPAFPAGGENGYDIDGNNPGVDRAVDFSKVATKSIAFVVSDSASSLDGVAGDNDKAATSDYSYLVNFTGYVGKDQATDYHKRVVDVFKNLASKWLSFPSLLTLDRFDNFGKLWSSQFVFERAHEGVISADLSNGKARITGLDYVSNGRNQRTWT